MRHAVPSAFPIVSFDRPAGPLDRPSLAQKLDAVLVADARVTSVGADPRVEALEAPSGLARSGTCVRRVRLVGGVRVAVVAVPSAVPHATGVAALRLKRAAGALGQRVLLVPETSLDRQPRLGNSLLIAGCAASAVPPVDRLRLLAGLLEAGGSLPLADAAEIMATADDPVAAALALVARGDLAIDMDVPVGPWSSVRPAAALVPRRGFRA